MEYVTIASTGNVTDFGDLTANRQAISKGSCSDNITGILAGGLDNGGSVVNIIEQITIAPTGNSTDFGDLITSTFSGGTATNGHGGLSTTSRIQDYNVSKNRAVAFGGEDNTPAYLNTVDYWNISSTGNAVDWGDLTRTTSGMSAVMCDNVRGCCGGTSPSTATIDMIIIESTGNASDFGDLSVGRAAASGLANPVRGVAAGGRVAPAQKNEIDFITIASAGNATDFGDLTTAKRGTHPAASRTRGLFGGMGDSPNNAQIDYITIATTGNAADFGDLTVGRGFGPGASSGIRGLFAGGYAGSNKNEIDFVTIATLGNATDFGDLTAARSSCGGTDNAVRATFSGGSTGSYVNTIDYVTIASTGDAQDFGDLTVARQHSSGSNGHGGLV